MIRIECRDVEPTESGFWRELSRAAGGEIASPQDAAQRLATLGAIVLILDDVDALRLLDTWLRRTFVPALPPNVHVIFSGRDEPLSAWLQMPWTGAFRMLELAPLADPEAIALLTSCGIGSVQALRVNRLARGHPLALTLAAMTMANDEDPAVEDVALHRMVDELARRHLSEIDDGITRQVVEAASVVRSVTTPLLAAMLPNVAPSDAYERLRTSTLARLSRDGLRLHDTLRDAIARHLRAADPERHLAYRRACWSRLNRELRTAPVSELWRCTADLLYLLENSVVREAFFPSGAQRYAIEPARAEDASAIVDITARHDGAVAARATADWWAQGRDSFYVAREPSGEIAGYYLLYDAASLVSTPAFRADPVISHWLEHLGEHPVEPRERTLFLRRWLSSADGERPCAVQAACWLDIKRAYMANRPSLRRVYLALRDVAPYGAAATQLGFAILPPGVPAFGHSYTSALLNFGPASVDGWLAKLVAAELGVATSEFLDIGAREIVVGSRRAPLTPREFKTLHYLVQHTGTVVPRENVLAEVWGSDSEIASNVVDSVIRSLRKKLGERATAIETVARVGYRFRGER